MKSLPLTKQELAYIEAHKDNAEQSLRSLIHDIKLSRRHLASHLSAFQSISEFLQDALNARDDIKMRERLADALSVAENFSVPLQGSYQEIMKVMLFDPSDASHKSPVRRKPKAVA